MNDLTWVLIRQDDNGNRYRVSRFHTREEAETAARRFEPGGPGPLYVVERLDAGPAS